MVSGDEKPVAAVDADPGSGDTYTVYARFRRGRLVLARRLPLDEARAFADSVRRERFHDPEGVFARNDRTGALLSTEQSPAIATVPPVAAQDEPLELAAPRPGEPVERLQQRAPEDELFFRAERCLRRSRAVTHDIEASLAHLARLMATLCRAIPSPKG